MRGIFKLSSAMLMAGCVSAAIAGEPTREHLGDRPDLVVSYQQLCALW
jgi:hypothetical protein